MEGIFLHLLIAGKNHPDNPEKDDIVSRNQHVRGIEIFQILRLLRPPQSGKRPQGGRKPGIQRVGILGEMPMPALRTYRRFLLTYHRFPAFIAVISGNPVPPPELSGDTPVSDIIRPVIICLFHSFGNQLNISILYGLHRRLYQLIHLHKPLLLNHRLYGRLAAVVRAYIVGIILNPDQKPHLVQLFYNGFPRLVAVHPAEFTAVFVNRGVVV